jgi:shikimate kinase
MSNQQDINDIAKWLEENQPGDTYTDITIEDGSVFANLSGTGICFVGYAEEMLETILEEKQQNPPGTRFGC